MTVLAGALRFAYLGRVPPGLYHDEAFNGLDALQVLAGNFSVYFPGNHGREPLFIYLTAAAVRALGRTPAAVRLGAAICGTLTVPATYVMAHAWFDRSIGLLSAAILSITVWHIQLSRIGFRAVMLPLGVACFVASLKWALRSRSAAHWLLSGVLYGLLFYTYVAAQFTPVALLCLAAWMLAHGKFCRVWPGILIMGIAVVATLAPLGSYAVRHWDTVVGRPAQVSILNEVVHKGDLWRTVARHIVKTAGMFFIRGDTIPRHNVPGRPVFSPLLGVAMIAGTVQASRRAYRGDGGSALALIWTTVMLIPTVAAADAPHFLRAVGALPLLTLLPALGIERLYAAVSPRAGHTWTSALICLVVALGLGSTVHDYFIQYASSSQVAYAFESAATELAAQVNRFTGVGWKREEAGGAAPLPDSQRRVYLDRRLWQAWESVPFLVPAPKTLTLFNPQDALSLGPADEWLLLVWPYDDLQRYIAALPHPGQIEAHAGPAARGDLEEEAYPAFVSYRATRLREQPYEPLAQFGESIELVDFGIEIDESAWNVRLLWRARQAPELPYTVFVCLCDDLCTQGSLLAQRDTQPGDGFYPTTLWRAGDVIEDVYSLTAPSLESPNPSVAVGLYTWPTLEHLPVTAPSGKPLGTMFVLPIRD